MSPTRSTIPRTVVLAALMVLPSVTALPCGGTDRPVGAFCSTLESEQARILEQFESTSAAGGDDDFASMFASLGASVQAMGELRTYFTKLSKVAPEEIRTEAEIVAKEYDQMFDAAAASASDPLGSIGTRLIGSMALSGPLESMNSFAKENCGRAI